jgi:hypothetical protein
VLENVQQLKARKSSLLQFFLEKPTDTSDEEVLAVEAAPMPLINGSIVLQTANFSLVLPLMVF